MGEVRRGILISVFTLPLALPIKGRKSYYGLTTAGVLVALSGAHGASL